MLTDEGVDGVIQRMFRHVTAPGTRRPGLHLVDAETNWDHFLIDLDRTERVVRLGDRGDVGGNSGSFFCLESVGRGSP
jgi:hypothetical protein